MSRPPNPPIQVAVLAFEGCVTSVVTGTLDALRIANLWARQQRGGAADPFVVRVLARKQGIVQGSSGFAIPAHSIANAGDVSIAIVPPMVGPIGATLAANPELVAWLRRSESGVIASVCAGAFFLAEAGLLGGRRATLNPLFVNAFSALYADVTLLPEQRLVDAGRVLSAGSTTAFLDLSIYLIDRFVGHDVAVLTAKTLCLDKSSRAQQRHYLHVAPKDHGDEAVLSLQEWMDEHYTRTFQVGQLARRAAMSARTLNRRFRAATGLSPLEYLHRLRIEAAKRLLETSSRSVEEITTAVGYEDQRSFSRLFRSLSGLAPSAYRQRFGASVEAWPQTRATDLA